MQQKKFISFLMVLTLITSLFTPISANAQDMGTITVSTVEAAAGHTVDVPVRIDSNPGILGATLTFAFPNELTLLEGINGDAFNAHSMTPPGVLTSPCNFVWDGQDLAGNDILDGVILTLKFRIPDDAQAGETYNISVSYDEGGIQDNNLNPLTPALVNGSINITDITYGDLNSDNRINTADVILMRRHIALGYEQTINEFAADVNRDDKINTADVILTRRFITGDYGITLPYTGNTTPDEPTPDNTVKFAAKYLAATVEFNNSTVSVKNEGTSKTTAYMMADNYEVYVNGVLMEAGTDDAIVATALAATNKRGTVTLIDSAEPAADGHYDKIMVDLYTAAQVTDVRTMNSYAVIDTTAGQIRWTPDDGNVDIFKNGALIDYTDVKVDDVVLILADPTVSVTNSERAKLYVSDTKVTGTAIARDTTTNRESITLDNGVEYMFADYTDTLDLGVEYTLFLDAMGYIYMYEQTPNPIGIVLSMYKSAGDDNETVRLVDTTGETVEYEVRDAATATAIRTKVGVPAGGNINKIMAASEIPNRVISYTISNGKLNFDADQSSTTLLNTDATTALEYKASTGKLGKYAVSATDTTIINLEQYLNGGSISTISVDALEDEFTYDAYIFNRNSNTGVCGFVVMTRGINTLRAKSTLAIVTKTGKVALNEDGEECDLIEVARNGESGIEVLLEAGLAENLREGSIIMYSVGDYGYVERNFANDYFKVIYSPEDTYGDLDAAMFAADVRDFTATAGGEVVAGNDQNPVEAGIQGYTLISNAAGTADDVEIFFGPVYRATTTVVDVLTGKDANGYTDADEAESITIGDANVYTVDYGMEPGYGERVSMGGITQSSSFYNIMYKTGDDTKSIIDWSKRLNDYELDRKTAMVFVRIVDGITKDVVYFIAD
ncbi:MAG: cohesin domain-containing protein [Clostridiales bacterium]|nr:cohesin domain-containing protein [Clostridiales bacterium]